MFQHASMLQPQKTKETHRNLWVAAMDPPGAAVVSQYLPAAAVASSPRKPRIRVQRLGYSQSCCAVWSMPSFGQTIPPFRIKTYLGISVGVAPSTAGKTALADTPRSPHEYALRIGSPLPPWLYFAGYQNQSKTVRLFCMVGY